jgi:hypothetical protein
VQTVELELELEPDPVVALIVTWVELAVVFGVFTVTVPVSSVNVNPKSSVPADDDGVKVTAEDGDDMTYPLAVAVMA